MAKQSVECSLFSVILITFMLTTASILAGPAVLAVKKGSSSSTSSVKTVHKTSSKSTTTTKAQHIKGVKVSRVHTVPSKVAVGSTFGLRGIVFNNSTATITFANGTCTSPLSITFNKNVMTEPQALPATCKGQEVTLKPGGQSPILSPKLSGITYRATAPGTTNATITFKYSAVAPTSKSHISDSISRVYTFNILPAGSRPVTSSQSTPLKLTGSASLLSIKYPGRNATVPTGSLIAASGTSAPSNSTHTNCNVGVKINQGKYIQATPQGPKGAGDYTKWTAITTTPTKLGLNEVEARLLCFPPGNLSTPNLVKHSVRNVTAIQAVGGPGAATAGPSPTIP